MKIVFQAFWAACKDFYEEMFILVGANLLWVLLAIPVITLPPATAGMYYLTNQVAHRKAVHLRMFFAGFKKYFVKSWLLALLNLLVIVVLWVNYRFYGGFAAQWATMAQGLFVGLWVLWSAIQAYVFPMLLEQQEPRLLLALRNAAFLAFASPIAALVLGAVTLLLTALSVGLAFPFAFALMAMIGLLANEVVLRQLVQLGVRQAEEELKG